MLTDIDKGLICPYCEQPSQYVDSEVIYGRSYGMIYLCKPCDAYVGVHKGEPTVALGRLANKELRNWKKAAHEHFDLLWKDKIMTRDYAYEWLSFNMGVDREHCHIGMFDVDQCQEVIELVNMFIDAKIKNEAERVHS